MVVSRRINHRFLPAEPLTSNLFQLQPLLMGKKRGRPSYDTWTGPPSYTFDRQPPVLSEPQEERMKFASHFQSPTVCVFVGPEKTAYYLHSQLLKDKCPFFRATADFHAKSQSNGQESISWENMINCEIFNMFVEYLYRSEYTIPAGLSVAETCDVTRLYRLADYLMMDDLKHTTLGKTKASLINQAQVQEVFQDPPGHTTLHHMSSNEGATAVPEAATLRVTSSRYQERTKAKSSSTERPFGLPIEVNDILQKPASSLQLATLNVFMSAANANQSKVQLASPQNRVRIMNNDMRLQLRTYAAIFNRQWEERCATPAPQMERPRRVAEEGGDVQRIHKEEPYSPPNTRPDTRLRESRAGKYLCTMMVLQQLLEAGSEDDQPLCWLQGSGKKFPTSQWRLQPDQSSSRETIETRYIATTRIVATKRSSLNQSLTGFNTGTSIMKRNIKVSSHINNSIHSRPEEIVRPEKVFLCRVTKFCNFPFQARVTSANNEVIHKDHLLLVMGLLHPSVFSVCMSLATEMHAQERPIRTARHPKVDKREEPEEVQRPLIFIAHSLGGIVVKQALLQVRLEPL
ncbi:BTB/POZ domain-containing protein [Cladophialophora immunda]|nr:BTB/POZ domain-containing protein [Cladophialophora immunda]